MKKIILRCSSFIAVLCFGYLNGCEYERHERKRFAFPLTLDYHFSNQAYNNCGKKVSLIEGLIGTDRLTFKDLSLFIRLCDDNHVRIDNVDPRAPVRDQPIGPSAPFGGFRDDLYTTLIAPVTLSFGGVQESESVFNAGFVYRTSLSDWKDDTCHEVAFSFGIDAPFKNKRRSIGLSFFENGSLLQQVFAHNQTIRENTAFQFFADFTDVADYFMRMILGESGLVFESEQRRFGIGDLSLYTTVELIDLCRYLENWQLGLTIVVPSGNKATGSKVWELLLGNGGACQIDLLSNWFFHTTWWDSEYVSAFNPEVRLAVELSAPFYACQRVNQKTTAGNAETAIRVQVKDVPGLDAPARFNDFWVDAFSASDNAYPWFAGSAVRTRIKYGPQILVGIADYIYNPFYDNFRLGLFYDFTFKAKDHYRPYGETNGAGSAFDVTPLERYSEQQIHRLGWNLTYKFPNFIELTIGSQHAVAGKNANRMHDIYGTFVLVF